MLVLSLGLKGGRMDPPKCVSPAQGYCAGTDAGELCQQSRVPLVQGMFMFMKPLLGRAPPYQEEKEDAKSQDALNEEGANSTLHRSLTLCTLLSIMPSSNRPPLQHLPFAF